MGLRKNRGIEKVRGRKIKNEKSVILVSLEGDNRTEREYLNNFKNHERYVIRYAKGNDTAPLQLLSLLKKSMADYDIDFAKGDVAACVFDADTDISKQDEINQCIRKCENENIEAIISNPCFEIWLLCHFHANAKFYKNEEVISELKKYLPNYEKNINVYPDVVNKTIDAINNSKHLEKHHEDAGHKFGDINYNPSTNFYKIVEILLSKDN